VPMGLRIQLQNKIVRHIYINKFPYLASKFPKNTSKTSKMSLKKFNLGFKVCRILHECKTLYRNARKCHQKKLHIIENGLV